MLMQRKGEQWHSLAILLATTLAWTSCPAATRPIPAGEPAHSSSDAHASSSHSAGTSSTPHLPDGYVPAGYQAHGALAIDRSQPPPDIEHQRYINPHRRPGEEETTLRNLQASTTGHYIHHQFDDVQHYMHPPQLGMLVKPRVLLDNKIPVPHMGSTDQAAGSMSISHLNEAHLHVLGMQSSEGNQTPSQARMQAKLQASAARQRHADEQERIRAVEEVAMHEPRRARDVYPSIVGNVWLVAGKRLPPRHWPAEAQTTGNGWHEYRRQLSGRGPYAPQTEAPKPDAPKTDAPKTDAPKAEDGPTSPRRVPRMPASTWRMLSAATNKMEGKYFTVENQLNKMGKIVSPRGKTLAQLAEEHRRGASSGGTSAGSTSSASAKGKGIDHDDEAILGRTYAAVQDVAKEFGAQRSKMKEIRDRGRVFREAKEGLDLNQHTDHLDALADSINQVNISHRASLATHEALCEKLQSTFEYMLQKELQQKKSAGKPPRPCPPSSKGKKKRG